MRLAWIGLRLLVAVAIVAAIVAQLHSSIDFTRSDGTGDTTAVVVNFFSYFTVDSNLLTVAMLGYGARLLLRSQSLEPGWFTVARASVTTYMVITGIVYNLLLRAEATSGAVVGWSNEILHVIAPAYVLLDWLLAPERNPVRPQAVLPVLGFPLLWIVYTLVRGPWGSDPFRHTSYWYPYPFIDPETSSGGYASVAAYVVGISVTFVAVASLLCWASRRWTPALG